MIECRTCVEIFTQTEPNKVESAGVFWQTCQMGKAAVQLTAMTHLPQHPRCQQLYDGA